jgi:hypothetical protein
MKKILTSVLVIAVWMIVPLTLWAVEVTRDVVSNKNTKVFYYGPGGNTYPVAPTVVATGWNSNPDFDDSGLDWVEASLYPNGAYLNPDELASPFYLTGAEWISYSNTGYGPAVSVPEERREVYLYRKTFKVPSVAYNVSGDVAIASDNYGWLYLNGVQVLEPRDPSKTGRNFESPPSTATIPAKLLACSNVLAAEVQDGCGDCGGSTQANGPTGTIFSLTLNYDLPDVDWRPPLTNSGIRKNGSTLPLKFRFNTKNGKLIKKMQYVYLAVHEGGFTETEPLGDTVAKWTLGTSVRHLRFSKGDGQYIANFQTQKLDLDDGPYTAVVHDGCTGQVLGTIPFELVGKKKEKDPKPPKPKK